MITIYDLVSSKFLERIDRMVLLIDEDLKKDKQFPLDFDKSYQTWRIF